MGGGGDLFELTKSGLIQLFLLGLGVAIIAYGKRLTRRHSQNWLKALSTPTPTRPGIASFVITRRLPPATLNYQVVSYLDRLTLVRCQSVCWSWRISIGCDVDELWRRAPASPPLPVSIKPPTKNVFERELQEYLDLKERNAIIARNTKYAHDLQVLDRLTRPERWAVAEAIHRSEREQFRGPIVSPSCGFDFESVPGMYVAPHQHQTFSSGLAAARRNPAIGADFSSPARTGEPKPPRINASAAPSAAPLISLPLPLTTSPYVVCERNRSDRYTVNQTAKRDAQWMDQTLKVMFFTSVLIVLTLCVLRGEIAHDEQIAAFSVPTTTTGSGSGEEMRWFRSLFNSLWWYWQRWAPFNGRAVSWVIAWLAPFWMLIASSEQRPPSIALIDLFPFFIYMPLTFHVCAAVLVPSVWVCQAIWNRSVYNLSITPFLVEDLYLLTRFMLPVCGSVLFIALGDVPQRIMGTYTPPGPRPRRQHTGGVWGDGFEVLLMFVVSVAGTFVFLLIEIVFWYTGWSGGTAITATGEPFVKVSTLAWSALITHISTVLYAASIASLCVAVPVCSVDSTLRPSRTRGRNRLLLLHAIRVISVLFTQSIRFMTQTLVCKSKVYPIYAGDPPKPPVIRSLLLACAAFVVAVQSIVRSYYPGKIELFGQLDVVVLVWSWWHVLYSLGCAIDDSLHTKRLYRRLAQNDAMIRPPRSLRLYRCWAPFLAAVITTHLFGVVVMFNRGWYSAFPIPLLLRTVIG